MKSPLQRLKNILKGLGYFEVGDIIRNKNPYKGEPSYRIEKIENREFLCSRSPEFDKNYLSSITFDSSEFYEVI